MAKGQVITFDGFLKVYLEGNDDEEDKDKDKDNRLPAMTIGQELPRKTIVATERFSKHAPRFTEASLVKRLEELGIGRPSTYAPTISTVQKRGYVEKGDRDGTPRNFQLITLEKETVSISTETENTGVERSKLFPTDIGIVVNDFLIQHFDPDHGLQLHCGCGGPIRRNCSRSNGLENHAGLLLQRIQKRRRRDTRKRRTSLWRANFGQTPRKRKDHSRAHWTLRPNGPDWRSRG